MKSGYEILWSSHALKELEAVFNYLENNFTDKEINKLASEIEETIELIKQNPKLFREVEYRDTRKVVILKFNNLYYRINKDTVEILSFFSNRQDPDKLLKLLRE